MPELRDYQKSAIDKIRNYFAKGKKNVLLVAPTGSGKTVIASSMIDQALSKGKSCLFVAHRRELVMQCSRKLADFRVNHGVLMANKSETEEAKAQVASVQTFTARKDRDDFVKPQADLVILG
jgi:DNA repair protein RadD